MSRGSDFWSRRKAQVEAEERAEAAAKDASAQAAQDAALEEKTDAELCEELGLPDPDSLQPGDDFKAFMGKAVPDRLRRRALRRLWLSNPALANLDGLLDYGEDFTDSALVVENLQTAYQVGKGMLKHVEEMARQAALEDAPPEEVLVADATVSEETPEPEPTPEPVATLAENDAKTVAAPAPAKAAASDTDEPPVVLRRRMQFTFTDHAGDAA